MPGPVPFSCLANGVLVRGRKTGEFSTKLDLAKYLAKWISEIDDADDGNDN
jgi:hypothetical protein